MGATLGGESPAEHKPYEEKLLALIEKRGYQYRRLTNTDGTCTHTFLNPSGIVVAQTTTADLLDGIKFIHNKVKDFNV